MPALQGAGHKYLHGIFDNEQVTRHILNKVREKKGMELQAQGISFDEYREQDTCDNHIPESV